MKIKMAALIALVAVLAGCAVPGAPRYSNAPDAPFHASGVASGVTLKRTQTVGVIFSENTVANLAYMKSYNTAAQSGLVAKLTDSRITEAYVNSSDPELAINWFAQSLEKQFSKVAFYENLDDVVAARPDVIVLLDTRNTLITERSADVQASISAEFFDSNFKFIGKAEGSDAKSMSPIWAHTKRAPEIAAQINEQRAVQVNALQKFDTSLEALIKAQS
ncbi:MULTISPECIES: ATPase [unclassified Pseudomonas]|uniref:ATPase n=1 Tax=unclassified Pseudomonas TaxID=196821 RepID=UPI00384A99FF